MPNIYYLNSQGEHLQTCVWNPMWNGDA